MTADSIRRYLSLGFVPEPGLASAYVEDLFAGPHIQSADPSKLVVEIIEERTAGASQVVIPLSGGRDSRTILGGALALFAPHQVHCITFGSVGSADVEGARAVCRNARVSHQVIDPDTLQWNLDELTGELHRRLIERTGIPPIDGMLVFGELARAIPPEVPVLSGYLGIVAAGKHLNRAIAGEENCAAISRFLEQNRGVLECSDHAMFREFLERHAPLLEQWPGLTKFDLLDFGFRQRLRIRSSVTGSFANAVCPLEDRRWIAHWFSQPLAERMDGAKYDSHLARSFPLVFGRQPLLSRIQRWRGRRRGRGAYRGDPRQNPSMAAALDEACRAFDRRDFHIGHSATAAFNTLMREGDLGAFRKVRWFATAELLARAQERFV